MPLGTPAPLTKRKKPSKIITDLSHIPQDGKAYIKWRDYETKLPLLSRALSYKHSTQKYMVVKQKRGTNIRELAAYLQYN